ncbi:uncharacterized protein TNIN_3521 [Trichonephila inaurata madagascariensis]|uniref:Uncharacterized protein n=1 Tax=Trichonephila inaurata madagascariensis TaxID=2747483 RepID=A0A8X6WP74_9ARAC|nr:uncharacterized protein TNIN_3521 [Trichonephila inaurata madagascariensis]
MLALVKDYQDAARDHIYKLLQNKETYGYLYFLNAQPLLVPLHVRFNAELIVDSCHYREIVAEIDRLAREFACPPSTFYDITRVELLYFFTLLVKPQLNWIQVNHLLRGNTHHDYLIAHPERIVKD